MLRTTFIVANATGTIDITVWGPPDQINVGSSYNFINCTVKFYEKKKLTSNQETIIKRVEDIKKRIKQSCIQTKRRGYRNLWGEN